MPGFLTRTPVVLVQRALRAASARSAATLAQSQSNLTTGHKYQYYGDCPAQTSSLLSAAITKQRSEFWLEQNAKTVAHIRQSVSLVEQATALMARLQEECARANTPANECEGFEATVYSLKESLVSLLNTRCAVSGSYLFSGAAEDVVPVDPACNKYGTVNWDDPDTPNDGYYQGSNVGCMAFIDNGKTVSSPAHGLRPGVEKAMRAATLAQKIDVTADPEILSRQLYKVQELAEAAQKEMGSDILIPLGMTEDLITAVDEQHREKRVQAQEDTVNLQESDLAGEFQTVSSQEGLQNMCTAIMQQNERLKANLMRTLFN